MRKFTTRIYTKANYLINRPVAGDSLFLLGARLSTENVIHY